MLFRKNIQQPGRESAVPEARGQVSIELVIITAVMTSLLLMVLLVNGNLQASWGSERQVLEATAAASQVALAINRAAAGGDGTTVSFVNTVSPDVTRVSVFDKRAIRAHYKAGGYSSAALVTNSTNITGDIPLNRQIIVSNTGGTITLTSGPSAGPVGASCGGSGQSCCASNTCDTGFVCSAGTCVACGAIGEPCCDASACNALLTCSSGTCQCGGSGLSCCGGTSCNASYACNSTSVLCQSCGGSGQLCCAGSNCSATYACNSTSSLCQSCGAAVGQLCCAGNSCTGANLLCNTSASPQPVCYSSTLTCSSLSSPNTIYTLSASASINGSTCFNVTAQNVTLDCNGYSITGNSTANTFGVYSDQFNTTIQDCNIASFAVGVYFRGATNGTISGTNANGTSTGIYLLLNANYNSISSSTATNGISISSSFFNTVSNSAGTHSSSYGLSLNNASNNTVSNSNFTSGGIASYFNTNSSSNRITGSSFTSPAQSAIYIVSGSNSNSFSGCRMTGLSNTYGALLIYGVQSTTVANSTINGNAGTYALTLQTAGTTGNVIYNNTILNATNLVYLDSSASSNTFYWNNFTTATGYYVSDANGNNRYNTTISGHSEGNVWFNVLNGSVAITGTNNSTGYPLLYYGTNGSGYPYNSTNAGGKLSGVVVDYAPLTSTRATVCGWTQRTSAGARNWYDLASSTDGTKLAAAASGDYIYTSNDSGATWVQRTGSGNRSWMGITSSADGAKLAAVAFDANVYTSNDSGANWVTHSVTTGFTSQVISSSDGAKLVAFRGGGQSGYIYTSTDSGANWVQRSSPSTYWNSLGCSTDGVKILATAGVNCCGMTNYIYTSADSGVSWTQRTGAGQRYWQGAASSSDGVKLAVAQGTNGYMWTSNDSGANWVQQTGSGASEWLSVASSPDGSILIAGVNGGYLYVSNNSGVTWTAQTAAGSGSWYGLVSSSNGTKFAAAATGGYIWTYGCQ